VEADVYVWHFALLMVQARKEEVVTLISAEYIERVLCCSMSVRDIVVQCLLHTEATRTVLDIIKTGVDTVEAVFSTQSRPVALI